MKIDVIVESPISVSARAAQVSSMFDVPPAKKARLEWHGDLPIEDRPWNVGLIVGPSGSGKSTILRDAFGAPDEFTWSGASVLDDFDRARSIDELAKICQAVGFNTIPAWLRPYGVLSNGERFRVDLARRLLEARDPIVCDEFTSVVDRQVARVGSHAVQKHVRRINRHFVAATCHYDLEDWLQPDWVLEPATMVFRWRSVQRRPDIDCVIYAAPHEIWKTFARFHYMSADLIPSARRFVLAIGETPVALCAVINMPHPKTRDLRAISRLVTLPDYQGLGLAFALMDRVAAAYKAMGLRLRMYPAHPSLVRSMDRSENWWLTKKPGFGQSNAASEMRGTGRMGARPCATFEYCGKAMDREAAGVFLPPLAEKA